MPPRKVEIQSDENRRIFPSSACHTNQQFFFFFLYNERKVSLNRAFLDGTILFHLNK